MKAKRKVTTIHITSIQNTQEHMCRTYSDSSQIKTHSKQETNRNSAASHHHTNPNSLRTHVLTVTPCCPNQPTMRNPSHSLEITQPASQPASKSAQPASPASQPGSEPSQPAQLAARKHKKQKTIQYVLRGAKSKRKSILSHSH